MQATPRTVASPTPVWLRTGDPIAHRPPGPPRLEPLAPVLDEVVPDVTDGLNAALSHGAALLRAVDPEVAVGALQADLPALKPAELDAALQDAAVAWLPRVDGA